MKNKKPAKSTQNHAQDKISPEVLAWAEFLYDEYVINKHKQLLLDSNDSKIVSNKGVRGD